MMLAPDRLLVPGESPLIARLHEVDCARQLDGAACDGTSDGALPFVGEIVHHVPGSVIGVRRRLSLAEDLYLADHHFVCAPGVKPLSACFPVVPMTVSLEIMAQAAACLAPEQGLTGFADVTATRWIALADTDQLALRIECRLEHADPARQLRRIAAAVFVEGEAQPSISAKLMFGKLYQVGLPFNVAQPVAGHRLAAAQLYAQRELFHGPRFQCLDDAIVLGPEGAAARLRVRAPLDWFGSTRQPQLLTDPALLDGVGQLMAVWAMQRERAVFPIGLGQMELYGPTPAPGTSVPIRMAISPGASKMLSADVEIEDGAGAIWMRIKAWKSWQFQWDRALLDFRRQPTFYLLSDAQALPAPDAGARCQRITARRIARFDRALLARHYLRMDEMAQFFAFAGAPERQLQWLLGRITAKDAARAWRARHGGGAAMLHPAAFAVENDARGQPRVAGWPDDAPPALSIAHCEDQAIALAHEDQTGVDIERVAERAATFLRAVTSEAERELLSAFAGAARNEWITRLWCAKEAMGKLMGTGLNQAPQRFEAQTLYADGAIAMLHGGSGRHARVTTIHDGHFMIAFALSPD
ncbi:MAG: polyketide synthase dehydratase domain-containing protein [Burkholderiaceae bacterium]|nr:polyketide synthase dehydratase domain-containing protein [Burkholderiaceae bacterium]